MISWFSGVLRGLKKRGVAGSARVCAVLGFIVLLAVTAEPSKAGVIVGVSFVVLGEAWRVWAAGHLLKSRELALSGPYRHVQNPLYFGRLCILVGIALMARLPITVGEVEWRLDLVVLVVVLGLFCFSYMPRKTRVEGERLSRHHGEAYISWTRKVPVIIPQLVPFGRNVRAWTAERFFANGEHVMLGFMVAIVAVFAWRAGMLTV